MASSRSPSPLKIPKIPRKLSLPSLRRRSSTREDSGRRSSAVPVSPYGSDSKESWGNAPLPPFLKKSRPDVFNTFIDLEWQQRDRLNAGLQQSSPPSQWLRTHGPGDPVVRNRYANVEPFESNRIKLKVSEGENDYINASPIVLGNRRYISTQGPKESSVSHFYHMLANETSNTSVVVMLTQTHENNREKCFPYWPSGQDGPGFEMRLLPDTEDQEEGFEGTVSLISTTEDTAAKCTIRRLRLKSRTRRKDETQEPAWEQKEIVHLLFGGWPDFAIPEGDDRQALMQLINLSRKLNAFAPPPRDTSFPPAHIDCSTPAMTDELNPRIVHCSAGVGRSGTFIALDHLLTLLDAGRLDDVPADIDPIAETVDRLRQQRMMMVQGDTQFFFLYDALREAWVNRWHQRQQSLNQSAA
ncbi:hypothetical protein K461DRAFT_292249 [Myriangium duriaei CBS 260.36]|uniref:Uncharacterized protein n=1 Tax=Myriangium duriaei CBS 260.36 TaxID=1168546 RepID=A0A9P4MJJ5_9PEZI|nr:hypothetical protein K461DRAFT_292249 [Myriangium duriaei CBS 260.36]